MRYDIGLTVLMALVPAGLPAIEKPALPSQPEVAETAPGPASTPTPTTAPAPGPGDRGTAYKTFRDQFDARRFTEALPAAMEVVTLSEQKFGANDPRLIIPLTNLGTTQLRLKDYEAAESSFQRALKIVETREGGFSRDIIRPLFGLGVVYLAAGQPAEAAEVLRRAVEVNRRIEGLFNPQQIELLDPLIESYVLLNSQLDAEREQQYALHVGELAYGKDDPRLLPSLDVGARRYEEMGRYASARGLQNRAMDIVRKAYGNNDVRMVEPLRGIARTFRLEYVHGPESTEEKVSAILGPDPLNPAPQMGDPKVGLESAGRMVLDRALRILRPAESNHALRGNVLIDLGDWNLLSGDKRRALQTYKEAWKELSSANPPQTQPLSAPVQLVYRGPSGTFRRPPVDIEEYEVRFVEVEFTVTQDGLPAAIDTVAKDATDAQEKAVVNAIKKARYRPRFAAGEPVSTEKVRYRQTLYIKAKKKN